MAANGIPLHCNICPRKPDFSDVSHLLTHIASKGHLSNYYKVKVRSTHEEASRRLIEAYDHWYGEWSVEELMSERMNQKDKRRARPRPAAARPAATTIIEAPVPRPARRAAMGNLLDPRLAEQQQVIKLEQSVSPSPTPQLPGPMLRHRNTYAAHMQYWSADSRASSHSYTNADYETSSEYSDPNERRRYRPVVSASCAIEDDSALASDPMAVSESTKLKGVYWPGMDIFDSATPEMRRKRNQKKDGSVVAQLELNSQEVEATELIFSPQGSFKRQRRISCSDSDEDGDLDIKVESPEPVRRRPALAYMDTNVRHRKQTRQPTLSYASRSPFEDHSHLSYGLVDETRTSKRKRFHVFTGDDENDHVGFSQPAQMNYLTSGFAHPQNPSTLSNTASYKPTSHGFTLDNKENVFPLFQHSLLGNPQVYHNNDYHFTPYVPGLGHGYSQGHGHGLGNNVDPMGSPFNNYMFSMQNHDQVDDDERTVTAPPSPSTG